MTPTMLLVESTLRVLVATATSPDTARVDRVPTDVNEDDVMALPRTLLVISGDPFT